jgi:hypothetical protein
VENRYALTSTLTNVRTQIMKKETCIGARSVLARVIQPGRAAVDIKLPITPLLAQEFERLLNYCSLDVKYPTLVNNIVHGFPIGPMPPISHTIIQKNHYKSEEDAALAEEYFREEVLLGRMFGPITILEAETLLGSCFQTSPIGMVPKAGSPGKFRVIRDLSFRGVADKAVNDWIDVDAPTHWVGFAEFAEYVSVAFYLSVFPNAGFWALYTLCYCSGLVVRGHHLV